MIMTLYFLCLILHLAFFYYIRIIVYKYLRKTHSRSYLKKNKTTVFLLNYKGSLSSFLFYYNFATVTYICFYAVFGLILNLLDLEHFRHIFYNVISNSVLAFHALVYIVYNILDNYFV